jgi:hypothetical protein
LASPSSNPVLHCKAKTLLNLLTPSLSSLINLLVGFINDLRKIYLSADSSSSVDPVTPAQLQPQFKDIFDVLGMRNKTAGNTQQKPEANTNDNNFLNILCDVFAGGFLLGETRLNQNNFEMFSQIFFKKMILEKA